LAGLASQQHIGRHSAQMQSCVAESNYYITSKQRPKVHAEMLPPPRFS
jgi:hypothetical protein